LIGFTPHDALTVDPDAEAIVLVSREIFGCTGQFCSSKASKRPLRSISQSEAQRGYQPGDDVREVL